MKHIITSILLLNCYLLHAQTQLGSDIDGEAANDRSGHSVSMSSDGSRVAIGANKNDGNGGNAGHVRVYEYSSGSWSQLGSDIDGEAADDQSGGSVSMNSAGDRVAIGAHQNDGTGTDAGHVRVYEYSSGSWSQLGSDIDGEAADDRFGYSVSMNSAGDRVAIGAERNDGTGTDAGHVRVYEYSNSSWTQLGSDIDGEAAGDRFGRSVSMDSDGDRVAIGAYWNDATTGNYYDNRGHVRVYEYSGSTWTQLGNDIDGETADDESGHTVSMSSDGSRVAIGAQKNDGNGNTAGHVRVYEYSNGSWSQLGSDIDSEAPDDRSGYSVSMSSDGVRVAIGAYGNNGNGSNSGHVRVYEYSSGSWTQLGSDIDGEAANDHSGHSVSMSSDGDRVAIGANYGGDGGGGYVRVYSLATPVQTTFQPQTTEALQTAVDLWVSDSASAVAAYGDINTWDVSLITDMSELFQSKTTFNDAIGNWDVSSVIEMGSMFNLASSFNQDLSSWDVSSVTNMHWMFRGTNNSNQDLSNWDVSSVTDMSGMFYSSSFNDSIGNWDVSSVTNMNGMFYLASSFSQDLSSWDVDSVTNMTGMFHGAGSFNGDISTWDVSGVTSMQSMFRQASSFNGDLSSWDVSSVTDMSYMFYRTTSFNQDISSWDISNVTTMNNMFGDADWNTPDLSDTNKCFIHWAFQSNDAWPYDWSDYCAPVISAIADTSMDEDSELDLMLSAYSVDGYEFYFEAESDTSSVYPFVEGDTLKIMLMPDWHGTSEISVSVYSVNDASLNDTTSFTLTVNPVDDLPFVDGHILPRNYPEDFGVDTVAYLPDIFTDIDGELTFSYSFTDTSVLAADVSSGFLVLSSLPDANGGTELMVTAMNPTRASVTDTVEVTVWAINDAPVVSIPDTSMAEDSEFFYDLSAYISDVDSENLMVNVENVSQPMNEHVQFHMLGPDTLRLFARHDWHGTGTIIIRVRDGQRTTHEPFTLTVNPVNDAPVFENLFAIVGVGMEFDVPILVHDVDMDSLVVSFDDSWDYPGWLSLAADPYRLEGTAPGPGQSRFPLALSDGDTSITDTFSLSAAFFHPRITSITDVPDDQGGRVYIDFRKSFFDRRNQANQLYTIFRHDMIDNIPEWVVVGSGAAIGDNSYIYEVLTLRDSTADDNGMTEFKVVASMNEGHFHSPPQSGYSLDNIAPGVPTGLMATILETGIHLSWDISPDDDFQYFNLEISSTADFSDYLTVETVDTAYLDTDYEIDVTVYYRLIAYDDAGNSSEHSVAIDVMVLWADLGIAIPDEFAIHQNYPNPFNPVTTLRYDLPEQGHVRITIYDMLGRDVKTLINGYQDPGYRSISWDATNDYGKPVSAGMYLYQIQAGEYNSTKKMVLLK